MTHVRQEARNHVFCPTGGRTAAEAEAELEAAITDNYEIHGVDLVDVPGCRTMLWIEMSYTAVGADTRDLRERVRTTFGLEAAQVVAPRRAETRVLA